MRLKQKVALLLTGIMIVGSIGMLNPTEIKAAGETNTFTLTVPADTNITAIGWNDIGNVGVSNVSIESGKKIEVTIDGGATGRNLTNTTDSSKKVGYEVKKGTSASNEAFGDSLEFTANGTQALGAVVSDFSSADEGTYEDNINFTAELKGGTPTEYFILEEIIANMCSITENNLVLNSGDTWENAIALNAGNKIYVNADGDDYELELKNVTIHTGDEDVECVVLGSYEDEKFYTMLFVEKGDMFDSSTYKYDFSKAYKPTDTIPDSAFLMMAVG